MISAAKRISLLCKYCSNGQVTTGKTKYRITIVFPSFSDRLILLIKFNLRLVAMVDGIK